MAKAFLPIARCRELLGKDAEAMTDEQIAELSEQYMAFARAFVGVCDSKEKAAKAARETGAGR